MKLSTTIILVFASIITLLEDAAFGVPTKGEFFEKRAPSHFQIHGNSGIAAMHIAVITPNKIIIIDKVQSNPLKLPDGRRVTSLEYDITNDSKRLLPLHTNTFCTAGSFMGNGTLVSPGGAEAKGSPYKAGFETLRIFTPCLNGKCEWYEDPKGLTSFRWYPTVATLNDGTLFILGGSKASVAVNAENVNNPTYEFFPKTSPKPFHFQFLIDTLPNNLYPFVHLMPGPAGQSHLFIFANRDSIIWDWKANKVIKKLPRIPGSSRNYPLTGTSVMLPLTPDNNYKPEILICGGNAKKDIKNPAENSCGRIDLSNLDTAKWEMDDFGGIGRVMPDAVILADGKTLFLNGASNGIAGYARKDKKTGALIPQATDAVLTSLIYDHRKPHGERFIKYGESTIPRYYHSVATLIPDGRVFVAGSSPQENIAVKGEYKTEFRIEYFSPRYVTQTKYPRGTIISVNGSKKLNQGAIPVKYNTNVPVTVEVKGSTVFTAALIHFGFVTHSNHMSQRYVVCSVKNVKSSNGVYTMDVQMPPNSNIIAPGHSYLFINNHGIPVKTSIEVKLS